MLALLRWIQCLWNAHRRAIDQRLLWPSFVQHAATLEIAANAFRWHMEMDTAYADLSHEERDAFVQQLVASARTLTD